VSKRTEHGTDLLLYSETDLLVCKFGRPTNYPALCGSHSLVTPQYYCRLYYWDFLCFLHVFVFIVFIFVFLPVAQPQWVSWVSGHPQKNSSWGCL